MRAILLSIGGWLETSELMFWWAARAFLSGLAMNMWAVPRLAASTSGSSSPAIRDRAPASASGFRVSSTAPASASYSRSRL